MSTLNCNEFESRLRDAVEQRSDSDSPEMEAHAQRCPACRALRDESLSVDLAILAWKSLQAPATVAPVQPHRRRVNRRAIASIVTAAASIALAVALWPSANQATPTIAENRVAQPTSVAITEDDDRDLEALVQDAGSGYLAFAADLSGAASAAALLVPSQTDFASSSVEASTAPGRPAWLEGWPEPLSPIQQRVGEALDFLLQATPAEAPASADRGGFADSRLS